jgi:hypothetical protein
VEQRFWPEVVILPVVGRRSPEVDVEASVTREGRWPDGRELEPGVAGRRDGEEHGGGWSPVNSAEGDVDGLRSTTPKEPRMGWA